MEEVSYVHQSDLSEHIDDPIYKLEAMVLECPQVKLNLRHEFTPGLYSRSIFMPAESVIISKKHKTKHQFIISHGSAWVRTNDGIWDELKAPYLGVTEPGTKRVLLIKEDCVWTTFHATDIMPEDDSDEAMAIAVQKIEDRIIQKEVNPYQTIEKTEPCHSQSPEPLLQQA